MTVEERQYLRELAKEKLEIANLPMMEQRRQEWIRHNDGRGERPMVCFESWTVQDKGFVPKEFKCESPEAQDVERQLLWDMFNYKMVEDDTVVSPEIRCPWITSMLPFGMPLKREKRGTVGFHIIPQLEDLEENFGLLKPSEIVYDKEGTLKKKEWLEELLGDILEVRLASNTPGACPTNELVQRMSMENMFVNMLTYPDLFKQMMEQFTDDYVKWFRGLEEREMLCVNNKNDVLPQGSYCFTDGLPQPDFSGKVRLKDMWFFMDSQETVGVSPEQYEEFVFPYYRKLSDMFGKFSYGCCEPVHPIWDNCLSKLENLRKVSISPWCDEAFMGSRLAGTDIIYLRKPSPNFVGVGTYLDEDAFREHIRYTLECAKNCKLEFAFRDVYNLEGQLDKPKRAVQIVREEIENRWQKN